MPPSATPDELRAAGSNYPAEIRTKYLQMPVLDPRVPELARQATSAAANPYDKAIALQSYLQTRMPTRSIKAASAQTIRWRIFFSCAKQDTANISRRQ